MTRKLFLFALQASLILFAWLPALMIANDYAHALTSLDSLACKLKENIIAYVDFTRLYACAQLVKTDPDHIWQSAAQMQTLEKCLQINLTDPSTAGQMQKMTPVRYTPQYIALAMPLSLMPLNQALIVFEIIAFLSAFVPITLLLKKYSNYSRLQIILWWAIVLGTPAFIYNMCLGQCETIIAGMSAAFLLTWENNNSLIAPLALALTFAIKPHHALIMLVMSLAGRRYRLLLFTLLLSLLMLFCSSLLLGGNTILKYPALMSAIEKGIIDGKIYYPFPYSINLSGTISMLLNPLIGYLSALSGICLFLIASYYLWRRALNFGPHTYPFTYAVSLLLSLILGPHSNLYALFLLNVAWAMTVPIININRLSKIQTMPVLLWCITFLLFPLISWSIVYFHLDLCAPLHLAVLLILLFLALINLTKKWQAKQNVEIQPFPTI